MILIEKKQQGGTVGKAGSLHVQPTDRSASLQFNPQLRDITTMGNKTTVSSAKTSEKLYSGMLPSDMDYIRDLKESKMQEITKKYESEGYEDSQENLRDLEEWRHYDSDLASKGKNYATNFVKSESTVKSRKAEASLAMIDGEVLAQKSDLSYVIMPYDELLNQDENGKIARPISVAEAVIKRRRDSRFNSFNDLGEFVDKVLINTYAPADLSKSMKQLALMAGTSSIPIDNKGTEVSVEKIIKQISKKGGISSYKESNAPQMMALANYFKTTIDSKTDQYLDNKAVDSVYKQLTSGALTLAKGETVKTKVEDYKSNLINDYFYNAISTKLKLGSNSSSSGPEAQKRYKLTPMQEALTTVASQTVPITVPLGNKKVEKQEYMGSKISHGRKLFNTNAAYGLLPEVTDYSGKSLAANAALFDIAGRVNFNSTAMADGTVLAETAGLDKVMIPPNAEFHLSFVPVKENPSKKGGFIPDFEKIPKYHTVMKDLHDMWANGELNSMEEVKQELKDRGILNSSIDMKPMVIFDIVLKNTDAINDRYVDIVNNDSLEDNFEDLTSWTQDKKISTSKAFMVVDNPSVFSQSDYFGAEHTYEVDVNARKMLTSGLLKHIKPLEEVQTSDETASYAGGGKAPSPEDIHKLLFNN